MRRAVLYLLSLRSVVHAGYDAKWSSVVVPLHTHIAYDRARLRQSSTM